jgi:periplasmic copper chaperone A
MLRESVLGAAGAIAFIVSASAHVSLETAEAPVGAPFKAVLRVPHGCVGSATTALRVRIPDGVIAVKPMPKPGWMIETVTGKYPKVYSHFHGAKLSEGVVEIRFSGGRLPDDRYDEFVFAGFVAGELEPGSVLYLPVVQECEQGVHRWIELPAAGKTSHDLSEPAPVLKLLPKR